ncbi:MAG: molybdate ABC transporter substrate-binding protein, partial [Methylomicrobium sp.]|nr:molybdate ABC transporter substrate-binding protein [Methylomicrobium sp.]
AEDVYAAVAANFSGPMQKIAAAFEKDTGYKVLLSFGATGKLYAQIVNGAPFEVFLSADAKTPERLENEGYLVAQSRFTYAIGKLALWSADDRLIDEQELVLRQGNFKHLAIANPKNAPYGAAAMEVLEKLGLNDKLSPKLVTGESISQAFQFVHSGNAQLGFVALSQIMTDGKINTGSAWLVPADLYTEIRQDAGLLTIGENNPAARALLNYLKNESALAVIRSHGYGL